jgi:dihydrofolate reductase
MTVSLLVAAAENETIGLGGAIPWHLPGDMRRFARLTRGHAVVMGRLTYDSIVERLGGPLPGRQSIVISRRAGQRPPGAGPGAGDVSWVSSPDEAAALAESACATLGRPEWFVIGGASVYGHLLPRVDTVYLTRVHRVVDGDARMPAGWLEGFSLSAREGAGDGATGLDYSFLRLDRVRPG